jgi:hypothetical protein
MKNQYFGDINDYRKYGLLRVLNETCGLRLGVCWMLTESDNRSDGEIRDYLKKPNRWRRYDPELYDALQRLSDVNSIRSVQLAEKWTLIPGALYFSRMLKDNKEERMEYFQQVWSELQDCPVIFFDQDNGMEVKSRKYGNQHSSKYLYWREVKETYNQSHSLVIYQHFGRVKRDSFIAEMVKEFQNHLDVPMVVPFQTQHVVFFLVARPEHVNCFEKARSEIKKRWDGQIREH